MAKVVKSLYIGEKLMLEDGTSIEIKRSSKTSSKVTCIIQRNSEIGQITILKKTKMEDDLLGNYRAINRNHL